MSLKMPPGLRLLRVELFLGMTPDGPMVKTIAPDNVVHMDPANQVLITKERIHVDDKPETVETVVHTSQWHGFPFVLVSEPTMIVVPE